MEELEQQADKRREQEAGLQRELLLLGLVELEVVGRTERLWRLLEIAD